MFFLTITFFENVNANELQIQFDSPFLNGKEMMNNKITENFILQYEIAINNILKYDTSTPNSSVIPLLVISIILFLIILFKKPVYIQIYKQKRGEIWKEEQWYYYYFCH